MPNRKFFSNGRKSFSFILVFVFIITSITIPTTFANALNNPDSSYPVWGGAPSYLTPDSALKRFNGYQGNPFDIPNPLSGLTPTSPYNSSGTGTVPASPSDIRLPEPPPANNKVNPVAPATGAVRLESQDISLPGNGMDFMLNRTYSSLITDPGEFGRGWSKELVPK